MDGGRRHRLDEARQMAACRPSIQRPVTSVSYQERTSNRIQMRCRSIRRDTIYTNVALTPDGDVWWEGKYDPPAAIDWRGNNGRRIRRESRASERRFATPMVNNPGWFRKRESRRRANQRDHFRRSTRDTLPLVYQAFNWIHGVYVGATMGSETTAAATGGVGRCGATQWPCYPSPAITWATTSATGW